MNANPLNPANFSWAGKLSPGEFKIGTTKTWGNGWPWIHPKTTGQDLALPNFEIQNLGNGSDNKWVIDSSNEGYYNITIDLANNRILFLKSSETGIESNFIAPLYWDVYENNFVQEKEGVAVKWLFLLLPVLQDIGKQKAADDLALVSVDTVEAPPPPPKAVPAPAEVPAS